jgi:hypothetical protein
VAQTAAKLPKSFQGELAAKLAEKGKLTLRDVTGERRPPEAVNAVLPGIETPPDQDDGPWEDDRDRLHRLLEQAEEIAERAPDEAVRNSILKHLNCAIALLLEERIGGGM